MSEQTKPISVYGLPIDWVPPTKDEFHGTTYIEYSVPDELEKELCDMIEKRLDKFYKECQCNSCKEERKNG